MCVSSFHNKFSIRLTRFVLPVFLIPAAVSGCGRAGKAADTAGSTSSSESASTALSDAGASAGDSSADSSSAAGLTLVPAGDASSENTSLEDASRESTSLESESAFSEAEEPATKTEDLPRSRRVLPSEAENAEGTSAKDTDPADTATSEAENESAAPAATYPSSLREVVPAGEITGSSVMFVPKGAARDAVVTVKRDDSYPDSKEDVDEVLRGLSDYWASYDLEAVDYLVRMDKFRYLSGTLEGTNDYYYYGDENSNGQPDGTGIAVYADNQYYYGSFADGVREGKGYWYQIYVRGGSFSANNSGVSAHSYNGEWKDDLPCGQGQEHLDIDDTLPGGRFVTNMIGTFNGGYYDGDFIVVSVGKDEGEINWQGTCRLGTWVPYDNSIHEGKNGAQEVRVLQNLDNEENYFYMLQDENHGQGVYNLIP